MSTKTPTAEKRTADEQPPQTCPNGNELCPVGNAACDAGLECFECFQELRADDRHDAWTVAL